MLFKNVTGQKIHVYAYDSTTGMAKTGDAANITAYVSLDGTANAIDDTNPAEVDATNMPGIYVFDLTQAETNCNSFALYAKSSTSNIRIEPIIGFTTLANLKTACDNYSATRGLAGTALPAAAADAAGGLPISDAGALDLDAKLANTNEVTAARMGALTDLIDGGRLDLLIDTIITHLLDVKGTGFTKDIHSLPQCLTATGFSTFNAASDTVKLNATQSAYAPAKAGDKMDMVDTPNATAIAAFKTALEAAGGYLALIKTTVDLIEDINRNQLEITDANGNLVLRADNGTDALYSVAACVTDNLTTTIRKRLE